MTIAEYILLSFPAIFVILNPFSAASSFLSMTMERTPKEQKTIAKKACITALVILLVFALGGKFIFQLFDITIPALRIAGGIVLFIVALDMIQLLPIRIRQTQEEIEEGMQMQDVAAVPLGTPILSGPGAITTVMVLMAETKNVTQVLLLLLACLLSCVAIYYILLHSRRFLALFKVTGVGISTRIMGLVLSVIAMQFVINGLKELLPEFARILRIR